MRKLLSVSVFLCLFASNSLAHISSIKGVKLNKNQPQNFRLEKVGGNVYALFGAGGNIGVSYGKDGLMTIDTQFAQAVPRIKAELKKLGTDTPKFVFNTHWHGDHTGGNELFGQDAMIIAHQNVYDRLKNITEFRGRKRTPTKKVGLPTITYWKGVSVYMNGEQVKAVHFPNGHTDGDTLVMFTKSNVAHLGDTFFVGRLPFVDLESGGSVEGLVKNIGKMIQMLPADVKIIPGHGKVSTIDDLKTYHTMLIETTLLVRKHMKAGKSLDEIKKAGIQAKYKGWASNFIPEPLWIETIYKSYSMKMKKTP